MKKIVVNTTYDGKVWFHERYLKVLEEGRTLLIEHHKKLMTVSPDWYKENPPQQSEKPFTERFGKEKGKMYYLYGYPFKADQNQDKAKANIKAQELMEQCTRCNAVKVLTTKGFDWQPSLAIFEKAIKGVCPKCKHD